MIRAVVFDLDGTLVDSAADLAAAVNHALRGLQLPERPLAEIVTFVGEGAARLVERAVAPHTDLVERGLELWWEHYRVHLLDQTRLYPGILELLRDVRLPMAVHTNKPGALARQILDGLGVLARFAEVVGGDEAPRKPDPAGTRALLDRLGVKPSEAVYVGDSEIDLALARAVPMPLLPVTWGLVPEERLRAAGATDVLRSVDELRHRLLTRAPSPATAALEQRITAALERRDVDAAVTEVLKGYGPQILGYLRAVIRDPEDAAEVFSQFAEDLWRGLSGFRGECSVRVWAYKVAWHAASRFGRDPYRKRRDRLATTMASRLADSILSSANHRLEKRSAEMERLRSHLTAEEQSLLVLRIDRQLSWREVAEVLAAEASDDAQGDEATGAESANVAAARATRTALPPLDERALRKRYERLKDKLARLAREEGLLDTSVSRDDDDEP